MHVKRNCRGRLAIYVHTYKKLTEKAMAQCLLVISMLEVMYYTDYIHACRISRPVSILILVSHSQTLSLQVQHNYILPRVGLSLICSKIYLLFLPEFPKIFTYYSYFIPKHHQLFLFYSNVSMILSQCRIGYIQFT